MISGVDLAVAEEIFVDLLVVSCWSGLLGTLKRPYSKSNNLAFRWMLGFSNRIFIIYTPTRDRMQE
jgi:hypothetical protein